MKGTIFVYGSLMTGFWNYERSLDGHVLEMIPAKVRGTLYHLDHKGYPALLPGDTWVYGEYMLVDDLEVLAPTLNKIESYYGPNDPRNEYEHTLSEIYRLDGTRIGIAPVYQYLAAHDGQFEQKSILIAHGSWRRFMEEK